MSDLISRSKVIAVLEQLEEHSLSGKMDISNAIYLLEIQPTAYDISKVVAELEDLEEEALQRVIGCAKKEYNNGWIAFTQREMTEEEKEVYGEDLEYILDCKLPDDGEEIIVCYKNGYVDTDTFIRDTDGCYLDSGRDFITEAIAWQPLPAPYKENENEN